MNGVFVNDRQRKHAELKEGDLVELGDISMRFRVRAARELQGEQTVMLRTVAPSGKVARDDEEMIA
jgi:pSer/pThr/pTyr-binding forkhead associated (FHA) protein